MCQVIVNQIVTKVKGKLKFQDAKTTCLKTGKPIIFTNNYGMYCEDKCGLEQDKQAHKQGQQFVDAFTKMFPR